ncbi:APC family permease [Sulfolobus sp. B5]|nr:APC family permease [Sulfolobus sp. B5]
MNRKKLSTFEAFSLSFGGQAPFTSIITFGTIGLQIGGNFLTIATIIGTVIVLINGLVIYKLSLKFAQQGGYFTYAFYSLTERLGLITGWVFILYAFSYGGTLLAGSIYIISSYIKMQFLTYDIFTLIIIAVSASLIIRGLEVSTKYAEFISIAEILAIIISSVVLLAKSQHLASVLSMPLQPFLVILYAIGMPIGYGNLNPMSEEIRNARRMVGLITVLVILLGGLLSALLFYAVSTYGTDLIGVLKHNVGFIFPYLIFSALNGGILGGIAYIISMSRIVYAMSIKKFLPLIFSAFSNNRPFNAEIFSLITYSIFLFLFIHFYGIYDTFLFLGGLTVLSYLTISISASFSLFRISVKKLWKRKGSVTLALLSAILSGAILVFSMQESSPIINYVFLGWIIIGFIYTELLEMISKEKN